MKIRNQPDTPLQINDATNEQIPRLKWLTLNGNIVENIEDDIRNNIELWSKWLSSVRYLSTRESIGSSIISKITGRTVSTVLDPTLLTDANLWDNLINEKWKYKNYIAIYQARNVAGNPTYLKDKAQNFANELECDVIDLSSMTYSVEDFVSIIKYAKYVLTTSFHATVFSLIMKTPCYAIKLDDGFDGRYVDLLHAVGLDKEIAERNFIPKPQEINFLIAAKNLFTLRMDSIKYLEKSL